MLLLLILSDTAFADDACNYFVHCGSLGGSDRTSGKSLPSTSTAGSLNPSNLSKIKGLGIETRYQAGNPLKFDLASGTGKVGALISNSEENSFFGNRPIELSSDFLNRRLTKKRYKNKKISFAVGLNLIDKKNVSIDIGFSAKRNPDIKQINPGIGASARFFIFTVGAYTHTDDVKVVLGTLPDFAYTNIDLVNYNSPYYLEKFRVFSYTAGLSLGRLSLDVGAINTQYKYYLTPTKIMIYSASLQLGRWMLNIAQRNEVSPNAGFYNGELIIQNNKSDIYFGAQFLINKHILLGTAYNNYLLHEVSTSLIFFL